VAVTSVNKEIVRRLYVDGLNAGDESVADELVADDFVNEGGFTDAKGPEAFKVTIRRMRASFPDLEYSLDEMIAEDDKVAVCWTMHATHRGEYLGVAPTGRQIRLRAIVVMTFRDGKVVGRRGVVDQFGLLKQLGAV
jgi:steroid delta-isomerase-like uncharacterized protein